MASTGDVQLVDRVHASTTPGLKPATGKCRIYFLPDRREDQHFLFPHTLKGADSRSGNTFNTHFKLDGRRFWLGKVARSLGSNLLERTRLHCLA